MILAATYLGKPLKNLGVSYGYIHSVYDKTLNLILSNRLVVLSSRGSNRGPFTINVNLPDSLSFKSLNLKEGSAVAYSSGYLYIDGQTLIVDTNRAEPYDPSIRVYQYSKETLEQNINSVKDLVLSEGSPEGVRDILKLLDDPSSGNSNATATRALPYVKALIPAVKQKDEINIQNNLERLIGLGVGTTPACDDMMCGMMLVMKTFAQSAPVLSSSIELFCSLARYLSFERTTRVSQEYILYASLGLANEASKNAAEALFLQKDGSLRSKFERLFDIGESSGTDTAVGMVLGAELCKENS
ncbi:MAG: DUF2877 domain-containing protein [Conexivisphaerales archaeon]